MSQLFEAMNATNTVTENGALAYESTNSALLDFFYKAPVSRKQDLTRELFSALGEDENLALRALLWLRDARGGAGERDSFRKLLTMLAKNRPDLAKRLVHRIPELGRFDDLEALFGTELEQLAVYTWLSSMREGNALAFKWAPRKDKKGAKPLRSVVEMNEAQWRKFVVANSDTVEQKLCAKELDGVNFEHVPSVAMARYGRAFEKNAPEKWATYRAKLEAGTAEIKAGAVFPHDVVKSCYRGDAAVASKQWEALPDFMKDAEYTNVLPVVDVSGSMSCRVSGETTAMDVAIALGIYTSERSKGVFKDKFITFSESPELQSLSGDLQTRVKQLKRSAWGYNTDLMKVFDLVLNAAKRHNVSQRDMPQVILIPSDMQFDAATHKHAYPWMTAKDVFQEYNLEAIERKFAEAGYETPKVVYWNLAFRAGGIPVSMHDKNTALVSGFSPAILKSVLSGEIDPIKTMLRTLENERYAV